MKKEKRQPSGIPMLDLLTGGYPHNSIVITHFMGNEFQEDTLQEFMERQALNFSIRQGSHLKTLLVTLQMDEKELCESLYMGKYESPQTLMESNMHVWALDTDKKVPDPGVFLSELDEYVRKLAPQALIIDAIDELIPKNDIPAQDAVSKMILKGLLDLSQERDIVIIVTDYGNEWEASCQDAPNIIEIELNRDIYDVVQATTYEKGKTTYIENLYGEMESPGLELVKAVLRSKPFSPYENCEEHISMLAGAAAVIIRQIDHLYKNTNLD